MRRQRGPVRTPFTHQLFTLRRIASTPTIHPAEKRPRYYYRHMDLDCTVETGVVGQSMGTCFEGTPEMHCPSTGYRPCQANSDCIDPAYDAASQSNVQCYVASREKQIGGSGGSLEPPGPLSWTPWASSYAPSYRLHSVL